MELLDALITGQRSPTTPRIGIARWIKLFWQANKMLSIFLRKETEAFTYLEHQPFRPTTHWSDLEAVLVARRISARLQLLIQLRKPGAKCLPTALATCTALRSLGLPCEFVLGRRTVRDGKQRYEFHASVEMNGWIVNNDPGNQHIYHAILRCPQK